MRAKELDPNYAIDETVDSGGGGGGGGGGSAGASSLKAPGGGVKCPGQVVPTTGT